MKQITIHVSDNTHSELERVAALFGMAVDQLAAGTVMAAALDSSQPPETAPPVEPEVPIEPEAGLPPPDPPVAVPKTQAALPLQDDGLRPWEVFLDIEKLKGPGKAGINNRLRVILALLVNHKPGLTVSEIDGATRIEESDLSYALNKLKAFGVITKARHKRKPEGKTRRVDVWIATQRGRDFHYQNSREHFAAEDLLDVRRNGLLGG